MQFTCELCIIFLRDYGIYICKFGLHYTISYVVYYLYEHK